MNDVTDVLWIILKILIIVIPLMIGVAYLTFAERKVIGYIQDRIGPNRVGPRGWLQPIADGLKLLLKEVIVPSVSNKFLYVLAPIITFVPALAAWAIVPFSPGVVLANVNAGVLYFLAITSLGVYGIIIAGWASNSKYAFLGALRSSAQIVSYEIAMGFAIVGVLMAARSLNLTDIVNAQSGSILTWYWLPLLPLFIVHWVSAVAETNRLPFDLAEGESEIVAGFHVEYGGMTFALFFLAEYANMILMSFLAAVFYFGGWLSPFQGIPYLEQAFEWVPPIIWLLLKAGFFVFLYLWFRATFPRYRYDQLMHLGWKVFIPLTFVWFLVVAIMVKLQLKPWFA